MANRSINAVIAQLSDPSTFERNTGGSRFVRGWVAEGDEALVNPMCSSRNYTIEAALMALNRARESTGNLPSKVGRRSDKKPKTNSRDFTKTPV